MQARVRERDRAFCPQFPAFLAGVAVLLAVGCGQQGSTRSGDATQNPYFQKAKKFQEVRDYKSAAEYFQKAIDADPALASAHLELGLICDDKLSDPIAAIYHYRRFLELRPDSSQKQLVQDFIERAKLSLAAKLPQSPIVDPGEMTRLQTEKAALIQENAMLKKQLAGLDKLPPAAAIAIPARATVLEVERISAPVTAVAAPTPTAPPASAPVMATAAPVTSPVAESSRGRTHVVQKGETLQSLALHYYGTRSAWDKIYQANRSGMPSKDQLKIGQQLVIP